EEEEEEEEEEKDAQQSLAVHKRLNNVEMSPSFATDGKGRHKEKDSRSAPSRSGVSPNSPMETESNQRTYPLVNTSKHKQASRHTLQANPVHPVSRNETDNPLSSATTTTGVILSPVHSSNSQPLHFPVANPFQKDNKAKANTDTNVNVNSMNYDNGDNDGNQGFNGNPFTHVEKMIVANDPSEHKVVSNRRLLKQLHRAQNPKEWATVQLHHSHNHYHYYQYHRHQRRKLRHVIKKKGSQFFEDLLQVRYLDKNHHKLLSGHCLEVLYELCRGDTEDHQTKTMLNKVGAIEFVLSICTQHVDSDVSILQKCCCVLEIMLYNHALNVQSFIRVRNGLFFFFFFFFFF
ncbi:hypothetical protein RFI_11382, partial [Reticulomyxa filosa]